MNTRWMATAAALISTAAVLSGCLTVQPAGSGSALASTLSIAGERASGDGLAGEQTRAADVDESNAWPPRWGDSAEGVGKGVTVAIDGPLSAWGPRRHGPWHARLPRGNDADLVRTLAVGRTDGSGYRFRLEGAGAFVFERDPDVPRPEEGRPLRRSEPSFMFVFVSGQLDEEPHGDAPRVDIERTWFAFYDHRRGGRPDSADPGLGTVMLLPWLFGIPEQVVDVVTSTMRQRGWNVIRMLAPPARFVELTEIELDPDDPESPAEAAQELMHRIAESAYAAEAAWAHVLAERPELSDRPKLAFGGSGGGLALPAVVRRDPGRYDGVVIVAGGANILDVVSRSTYTKPVQALDFAWAGYEEGETPPRDVLDRFTAEYLRHAPLDGYHAGEWIDGTPVLVIQASSDKAVPVENSEILWQRLGEPEKWTINGNHLTLFLSLWLHTPRILDWAQTNLLEGDGEGGTP